MSAKTMAQRWESWAAKFATLKPREKLLFAGAVICGIAFLGYVLMLEPVLLKRSMVEKQLNEQRTELAALQAQADMLRLRTNDPDAFSRARLAEIKKQLNEQEAGLRKYDGTLVPPEKITQLLESLLSRHNGLELVSLKTLPVAPLTQAKKDDKAAAGVTAILPAAVLPAAILPGGQIYRHGVEIKLAGSFNALHAYVAELEKAKQRPLWSGMELSVTRYPRAELTLTLYTLSMDSTWLLM